jgi:hypothetical protein
MRQTLIDILPVGPFRTEEPRSTSAWNQFGLATKHAATNKLNSAAGRFRLKLRRPPDHPGVHTPADAAIAVGSIRLVGSRASRMAEGATALAAS